MCASNQEAVEGLFTYPLEHASPMYVTQGHGHLQSEPWKPNPQCALKRGRWQKNRIVILVQSIVRDEAAVETIKILIGIVVVLLCHY